MDGAHNPNLVAVSTKTIRFPLDLSSLDPTGSRATFMQIVREIDAAFCQLKGIPVVQKSVKELTRGKIVVEYNWESDAWALPGNELYSSTIEAHSEIHDWSISKAGMMFVVHDPFGEASGTTIIDGKAHAIKAPQFAVIDKHLVFAGTKSKKRSKKRKVRDEEAIPKPLDLTDLDPVGTRSNFMTNIRNIDAAFGALLGIPKLQRKFRENTRGKISIEYKWESEAWALPGPTFYSKVIKPHPHIDQWSISKQGVTLIVHESLSEMHNGNGVSGLSVKTPIVDMAITTVNDLIHASKRRKLNET
jgi:hypothetical protein